MSSKPKFDENDRRQVIAAVERHLGVRLVALGSRRTYLKDENGHRYIVLGGYGDWHGIPPEIFAAEEGRCDEATLVIAKRYEEEIEIYMGSFSLLLRHKRDLRVSEPVLGSR